MDYNELKNEIKQECGIDIGKTGGTKIRLEQEIYERALSNISLGDISSMNKKQINKLKDIFSPCSNSPIVAALNDYIKLIQEQGVEYESENGSRTVFSTPDKASEFRKEIAEKITYALILEDYEVLKQKIRNVCSIKIDNDFYIEIPPGINADEIRALGGKEIYKFAASNISRVDIASENTEKIVSLRKIFSNYKATAVTKLNNDISLILKLKEPKNEKIYQLFTVESGEIDADFISSVEKFRGLCSRNKKFAALWLSSIQEGEEKEENKKSADLLLGSIQESEEKEERVARYMKKLIIYQNIKPYLDADQVLGFETGIREKLPLVDYTRIELIFLKSKTYKNATTYQKNRKLQYILEELQERLNNPIQQQDQSLPEPNDLADLQELLNEEIKKRDTSWYEDIRALTFPLAMFSSCVTSAYFPNISTGVTNFITFVPILGPAAAFLFTLFAIYENRFIDRGNQNIQLYLLILANVYTLFVTISIALANTIVPALSTILPLTGFLSITGLPLLGILFIAFMARGMHRTIESKTKFMPNIAKIVNRRAGEMQSSDVQLLKNNLINMKKRMYSVRNPLELRSMYNQLGEHIKNLENVVPEKKEVKQAILLLTNTKIELDNHQRRNLLILSLAILGITVAILAHIFAPQIAVPMTIAAMYIQGIGVGTIATVFGIDKALSNFRWWSSVFFKQEKTLNDITQSHTVDVQRNCHNFEDIAPLRSETGRRHSCPARTTLAAKVAEAEATAKAKAGEVKPPRGNIAKRRHSLP